MQRGSILRGPVLSPGHSIEASWMRGQRHLGTWSSLRNARHHLTIIMSPLQPQSTHPEFCRWMVSFLILDSKGCQPSQSLKSAARPVYQNSLGHSRYGMSRTTTGRWLTVSPPSAPAACLSLRPYQLASPQLIKRAKRHDQMLLPPMPCPQGQAVLSGAGAACR